MYSRSSVLAEDEHAGARILPPDGERGLEAPEARHRDVHEDDVGRERACELDGLQAVGRFADHLDVVREAQQRAHALAHDRVVIREEDPNLGHGSPLVELGR